MATLETYQVIASAGVVVDDGGNSIFYPAGAVFQGNPSNPSIQHHLSNSAIIVAVGQEAPPAPSAPIGGGVGPTGPQGLPGGPAGSLFSVKIRTVPFTSPLTLTDTGGNVTLSWPASTETLYDDVTMFNQIVEPTKVFVKTGGAGRYHVAVNLTFAADPNGSRIVTVTQFNSLDVYKDHATKTIPAIVGIDTVVSVDADFNCVADDYFVVTYRQTASTPLGGGASFSARLTGSGDTGPQGAVGAPGIDGSDGADGIDGAAGAVGPTGPGGVVGTVWQGNWSSITNYVLNDAVSYLGSSFVAIAPSLNDPPPSANWLVIAAQGSDGAAGAAGSVGPAGSDGNQGPQGVAGPSGGPAGATGAQGLQGIQGPPGVTASAGARYLNYTPTALQTIFTIPGPEFPLDNTKVEIHMRGCIYNTPEFFTVTGVSNQTITWLGAFVIGPNFPFKLKYYT
jgi:hypothetical protein